MDRPDPPAGVPRASTGSPQPTSNAMGGVPSSADARLSPSMSGEADLSSDPADRRWGGGMQDDDLHYRRFRDEHQRALDDDYRAWRQHRAAAAPPHADAGPEARDDSPLRSLGRAVSDAVTGSEATADPVHSGVRP